MKQHLFRILLLTSTLLVCCSGRGEGSQSEAEAEDSGPGHSMFVEPNFVDTQYSVLFEPLGFEKADSSDPINDHIPLSWIAYDVRARVVDVYQGDFETGETLDLLIYLTHPLKTSEAYLENRFLFSFCKSTRGIYYSSRDFLLLPANVGNVAKFEEIRERGTDYEGSGDYSSNYPSLNPDTHERETS